MGCLSKMYSFTQVISECLILTKGANVEKTKLQKKNQKYTWKI